MSALVQHHGMRPAVRIAVLVGALVMVAPLLWTVLL